MKGSLQQTCSLQQPQVFTWHMKMSACLSKNPCIHTTGLPYHAVI